MMKIPTVKLLANLRMKTLLMDGRTTSNPFWGRHAPSKLLTSSLSNLILPKDSGVALSMLLMQFLTSSLSLLVIVSLIHWSVFYPKWLVQASKNLHFCSALPLSRHRSDTRLQSRRSGRIILRPIRWRFVIFGTAACSGISPMWFCDHVSLPSSLCCELRNKFSASRMVRDVLREMVLSLSRSSESIKHQTDLCLIFNFCLKVASMFRIFEKNHVCGNATLCAGLVSCVQR